MKILMYIKTDEGEIYTEYFDNIRILRADNQFLVIEHTDRNNIDLTTEIEQRFIFKWEVF